MPLTADSHPTAEAGSPAGQAGGGGHSGYDVVSSAASPHTHAKPQRWDLFLLFNVAIPILLVLVGVAIIKFLGKAEAQPLPPPDTSPPAVLQSLPATRVEVIRSLEETGQQLELLINGTVVPYREARVSSEVAGRIIFKSDNCEAGSIVNEGDVLMRIDPTDYQLEVERLTRLREQEYRALGEVDQEMINANRSIELAEQDVQLKEKEVQRQTKLQSFASEAEVDKAKSAALQSIQQLRTLKNQLDLLRSRRSRLEASEQLAATQLSAAEVNLKRCEIVAPISGVIVSEQADLNTFVSRGTALVTIEDVSKVEVAASMRMDQLHWVLDQDHSTEREGYDLPDTEAIIEYEVAGRQDTVHRWNGLLVSYDGIGIDPNTRTVPVRLLVDQPTRYVDEKGNVRVADRTNALLRGMFVRVRLQLNPQTKLVVIPGKALRPGNRVWVFDPDDEVLDQQVALAKKKAEDAAKSAAEQNQDNAAADNVADDKAAGDNDSVKPPQTQSGDAAPTDQKAEPFDPTQWKAGLVRYSATVYPVDSLRLDNSDPIDKDLPPSLQSAQRVWVCEASKSDVASGDLVVVSPLDSIPPSGLPARAQIKP